MLSAAAPQTLEFDHLGLIVSDLAAGRAFLEAAFGITRWTPVTDDQRLGVSVQFGAAPIAAPIAVAQPTVASGPQLVYELIAPIGSDSAVLSPIAGALRQGKNVLNHVAYLTPSIAESAAHLRDLGCFATGDPQPAVAYSGHLIQFWVSPLRFLIELIEKPGHRHPLAEATPASAFTAGGEGN